jgi:hypothetical protein
MTAREPMPLWDEPAVWKVSVVTLSAEARAYGATRVSYPFHVRGNNLSTTGFPEFAWNVSGVADPRYDLSSATMDDETAAALAECAK